MTPGDAGAAAAVLRRLLGPDANKFDVAIGARDNGRDSYTVAAAAGWVSINGSTPATVLAGFNAYLG